MDVIIRGLTRQQANALRKSFESGAINNVMNELYFKDIFAGNKFKVLPQTRQDLREGPVIITYQSEN